MNRDHYKAEILIKDIQQLKDPTAVEAVGRAVASHYRKMGGELATEVKPKKKSSAARDIWMIAFGLVVVIGIILALPWIAEGLGAILYAGFALTYTLGQNMADYLPIIFGVILTLVFLAIMRFFGWLYDLLFRR